MLDTDRIMERAKVRYNCERDPKYRAFVMENCKHDTKFFINNFCYTFDPRLKVKTVPFLLFPKQLELVDFVEDLIENRKWGVGDKSRDMGFTWCLSAILVKHWLTEDDFAIGVGSRKAELVDNSKDPKCIFEKFRVLIKKLPDWMRPPGWEKASKRMLLYNPLNNSTIVGEGGDEIGRGGRTSFYFVDEWSFVPRSEMVVSALAFNTDAACVLGTPNGTNNEQFRMISSGAFPHFRMHWKDDPRKNQWKAPDGKTGQGWDAPQDAIYPWYELQKTLWNDLTIAQEIDIDYTASIEGIIIKAIWVQAAINAHLRIPAIAESNEQLVAGLDVAAGGANKSVLTIRRGSLILDRFKWGSLDPVQLGFTIDAIMRNLAIAHLVFDADGVGTGTAGTLDMIENKPYQITAFKGGSTEGLELIEWPDGKNGKEKFKNKRASAWYTVAERFRKTYTVVNGIKDYPPDELISIPNDPSLITQLSQPVIKYDPTGKIVLTPKNLLANSPDDADSLVYSFNPDLPLIWW